MAITAKDLKDLVRIVLLCIFWYVVGSSNGVLGKWILSEFPFPVTLTMVQVSIVCLSQNQGQDRGYGRTTHFLPSPEVCHDFHKVDVTNQVGQFKIPGCQMKDMDFVFPQIPFGLL